MKKTLHAQLSNMGLKPGDYAYIINRATPGLVIPTPTLSGTFLTLFFEDEDQVSNVLDPYSTYTVVRGFRLGIPTDVHVGDIVTVYAVIRAGDEDSPLRWERAETKEVKDIDFEQVYSEQARQGGKTERLKKRVAHAEAIKTEDILALRLEQLKAVLGEDEAGFEFGGMLASTVKQSLETLTDVCIGLQRKLRDLEDKEHIKELNAL